jgi:hypothetical protein
VTCVGLPSITTQVAGDVSRLQTPVNVDDAQARRLIKIHDWVPSEENRFDILPHDICVRYSMLKEFFDVTPEDVLCNSNCDMQFCEYIMSGGTKGVRETRSLFLQANHWTYYARPAETAYKFLTFAQLNDSHLGFQNVYQMIPFVIRIAEMKACPCLEHTADMTWKMLLEQVKQADEKGMLEFEYKRAQKERPWLRAK